MNRNEQIVITGTGLITPIGLNTAAVWDSLLNSRSGIGVRTEFAETDWPFRVGGMIDDFDGKAFVKPRKALKVMCRPIQYGFAAARMAMQQAGLADAGLDPDRIGTVIGSEPFYSSPSEIASAFQNSVTNDQFVHNRWGNAFMREIQPLWMLKYLPNMVASHISIALDARGACNSIIQGSVSSHLAIIEGASLIERGFVDVVVVGGTGQLVSLTGTIYHGNQHLSPATGAPEKACRPFDANRDGQVFAEGAGILVLESASHAERRKVEPLATLDGWSRNFFPQSSPAAPSISKNLSQLLDVADRKVSDIGHIATDGSGSVYKDAALAQGISATFGKPENAPAVFAVQANMGNTGPASGAIELVTAINSLQQGKLPPAINFNKADPACPVNISPEGTAIKGSSAISISTESTGQIASLLVTLPTR